MQLEKGNATTLDFVGGAVSCLCIAHCILLPMLIAWAPTYIFWTESEWVHKFLVLVAVFISAPLLVWKGNHQTRYLGIVGLSALIFALFLPSEIAEKVVTTLGSGLIVAGHILRHRACQCCADEVLSTPRHHHDP